MKTRVTALKKVKDKVEVEGKVDEQLMRVGLTIIGISCCVIGIWAAVSLISGMLASGGPLQLIANWFEATVS